MIGSDSYLGARGMIALCAVLQDAHHYLGTACGEEETFMDRRDARRCGGKLRCRLECLALGFEKWIESRGVAESIGLLSEDVEDIPDEEIDSEGDLQALALKAMRQLDAWARSIGIDARTGYQTAAAAAQES
jgi:hypothetical protein